MPQLHFYVPDKLAEKIKAKAEQEGKSVSSFLAELVKSKVSPGWPEGYWEEVVGAWGRIEEEERAAEEAAKKKTPKGKKAKGGW
jgi:hypothetical protein